MARGFNLTAELNLRGPSNIRTVVADIRRQLGTINANVNVRLDPGVARNITAINQTFRAFNNTLQATNASANATALSLRNLGTAIQQVNNGAANLPANLQQINAATRNVAQQNAAESPLIAKIAPKAGSAPLAASVNRIKLLVKSKDNFTND